MGKDISNTVHLGDLGPNGSTKTYHCTFLLIPAKILLQIPVNDSQNEKYTSLIVPQYLLSCIDKNFHLMSNWCLG
jgi:hypothetical protein